MSKWMNEWTNELPLGNLRMLIYMIIPFSNKGKKKVRADRQFIALRNITRSGITPHKSKVIYSVIFFNFYCYSITVVCIFSPSLHPTPAEITSLPHLHPPPWFCPCDLYSSSCNPLSSLSPPHSPLAIVGLFLTSMSLVIFSLLFSSIDYVPVKGEIIWYLSLTAWIISLSIMLSSSIHAVAKGISSFFLSTA